MSIIHFKLLTQTFYKEQDVTQHKDEFYMLMLSSTGDSQVI